MKIAALILAAGGSKRFGSSDKLTYDYQGNPLLSNAIYAIKSSLQFKIYAVIPEGHEDLAAICAGANVMPIFNPNPSAGQGVSLSLGIKSMMEKDYDAALIALGDMPNIPAQHYERLVQGADHRACRVSENKGVILPPCIVPKVYFPKLLSLSGDQGARAVLTKSDISKTLSLSAFEAKDIDRMSDLTSP